MLLPCKELGEGDKIARGHPLLIFTPTGKNEVGKGGGARLCSQAAEPCRMEKKLGLAL